MELYELKLRGLSGPFNKCEIIHLFRIGLLNSRMPCRLRGEAAWRTIGELFPLFEYRITSYSLPEEEGQSGRKIGRVAAGILVVIVLAAGVGSLLWPGLSERPMPGGSLRTDRDTPSKSSLVVVR
jgi:hypothetical protein